MLLVIYIVVDVATVKETLDHISLVNRMEIAGDSMYILLT